jgi:hypothetical protein
MTFNCFNYIKFSGGSEEKVIEKYFNLVDNLLAYSPENQGCIGTSNYNEKTREMVFISAWNPPIEVYNKIVAEFPDVGLYYEYQEATAGICGYGELNCNSMVRFTQKGYQYNTADEYKELKKIYLWVYPLYDPFFENCSENKIDKELTA